MPRGERGQKPRIVSELLLLRASIGESCLSFPCLLPCSSFSRLKDCDVTWLYGPLQTESKTSSSGVASPPPSHMSTSSSFLHKKPILKKRSASEAILQWSISEHSLLKQVGAVLKSQEGTSPVSQSSFERAVSDFSAKINPPEFVANTPAGEEPQPTISRRFSVTSSGLQLPGERKHIHFNDEVA